jgi:DNA-binding MarR family transcriptional regulator
MSDRGDGSAAERRQDRVDALAEGWLVQCPEIVGPEFGLLKRNARLHVMLEQVLLEHLRPFGVTKAEYDILGVLRSLGAPYRLRPSELAERIMLTSGGISNALRRLEARGLMHRIPDPADARASLACLTDQGAALALEAVREVVGAQSALLRRAGGGGATTIGEASETLRSVLLALGDAAPRSWSGPAGE